MRIVYIGAVEFSRQLLEETLDAGGEVVAVLTLPAEGAGFHGDYADLGPVAAARGVAVHRIGNVNEPATIELIRSFGPDVIFVFGWSQLLGPELLTLAPCVGTHPALLPRNRGRHPLTWALVEGLEETGLTFLWLDEGADSGDILWQRPVPIEPEDDAASLYEKITLLGREAVRELLPLLDAGTAPRVPQEAELATSWRKRTDEDRWIDWSAPTRAVHGLVRGLARPYVGALTRRGGQDVLVWKARPSPDLLPQAALAAAPGTVLAEAPEPVVRTGDGALTLVEVEPPGLLRAGDVLGRPA
jgi:methionyl-tRNA formyltransferase